MAGARGGLAGARSRQQKRCVDGTLVDIDICGSELQPERVLADVREGWISPARAREVYCVEVGDGRLDGAATARLRARAPRG